MTATHSMTSTQFEANVPSSTLFLHPGGFKRDVLTTGNNSLRRPGTELAFVNSITGERFKIWTICDFQKDDAYTNLPIFLICYAKAKSGSWAVGRIRRFGPGQCSVCKTGMSTTVLVSQANHQCVVCLTLYFRVQTTNH